MAYLITARGLGRMHNIIVDVEDEIVAKRRAITFLIRSNTSAERANEYIAQLESLQVHPDQMVVLADPVAYHNEITIVDSGELSNIEFYSYTKNAENLEIAVLD